MKNDVGKLGGQKRLNHEPQNIFRFQLRMGTKLLGVTLVFFFATRDNLVPTQNKLAGQPSWPKRRLP